MNQFNAPRPRRFTQRAARAVALSILATLALPAASCSLLYRDQGPAPITTIPPVRLEAVDGLHAVVMTAPNPGWDVAFDADEAALGHRRVLLTFTPPDPALIYPQVVVDKLALTDVPVSQPVRLAGRVVERRATRATGPYTDLGVASPGTPDTTTSPATSNAAP